MRACFSEKEVTIKLHWTRTEAEVASEEFVPSGRKRDTTVRSLRRRLDIPEARLLARRMVEAAERDEMSIRTRSTTSHFAALTWQHVDADGPEDGKACFSSREMMIGEDAARFVRDLMARGELPERAKPWAEEGFAKGFYTRAIGLFQLAEEILETS